MSVSTSTDYPHLKSPKAAGPFITWGKRPPFPLTQPQWMAEYEAGENRQDPWSLTEGNTTCEPTWRCSKGHSWKERLNKRRQRKDPRCPVCIEHETQQLSLLDNAPRVIPIPGTAAAPAAPADLRTTTEYISPVMATKYLQSRHPNIRPAEKPTVDRHARQMRSGLHIHTGTPISFDVDGYLINGQHRLLALIETGLTMPFQVTRGESREAWRVQNQDLPERARTLIGCMDRSATYPARRAQIANMYLRFQLGAGQGKTNIPTHVTFSTVERATEAHRIKGLLDWIVPFLSIPSCAAAAMLMAHPINPVKVERFVRQITKPTGVDDGSPVLVALDVLRAPHKNDNQQVDMAYRLLRCCQLYIEGTSVKWVKSTTLGYEHFLAARQEMGVDW